MFINTLIFLSNKLQVQKMQETLRIPLEFISFGFIEGKLYRAYGNDGTFMLQKQGGKWLSNVVYGGIFHLHDFDFYINLVDSYHQCSLSRLRVNHKSDLQHRIKTDATPITFNTLEEFSRLKYREKDGIEVNAYLGNLNHPKINKRLGSTISYRITDGVDENFAQLYREVTR